MSSSNQQINYVLQWLKTYSDFQREDFGQILLRKLTPENYINGNGVVSGIQSLDVSGRPPSLFSCQMKLFNEWYESWSEADRSSLIAKLKESDSNFWTMIEEEKNGTRKKDSEHDFFTVGIVEEEKQMKKVTNLDEEDAQCKTETETSTTASGEMI